MPAATKADALTPIERRDLAQLEHVVKSGSQAFIAVGKSLAEIRDRRLYRDSHGTFEAYCQERFGFSRQRGLQLIGSAETAGEMTTRVVISGMTEKHARALTGHPPEVQDAAWNALPDDGTAAELGDLLQQMKEEEAAAPTADEGRGRGASAGPARPRDHDARRPGRDRQRSIEGLCRKLKAIHAGLVDVADEADAKLEEYLAVIQGSTED